MLQDQSSPAPYGHVPIVRKLFTVEELIWQLNRTRAAAARKIC